MQDPNLPDGCTPADVDRAMGAMDPALEEQIDDAVAQLQAIRKILTDLKADAGTYREAFRKLSRRYDDAERELLKIREKLPWSTASMMDKVLYELASRVDVEPDSAAIGALNALSSDEDFEDDMKIAWEENHGR